MTIRSRIKTRSTVWIIPLGDNSKLSQRRLRRVFRWMCTEAKSWYPRIPTHTQFQEYITDPLHRIRAGAEISDKGTSRWFMNFVIASEECEETIEIGMPLLRFLGALGDESAHAGSFVIELRQAIDLLSVALEHQIFLFKSEPGNGSSWFVTTDVGTALMGVAVRIELADIGIDSVLYDEGQLSCWCSEESHKAQALVLRRQQEERPGSHKLKRAGRATAACKPRAAEERNAVIASVAPAPGIASASVDTSGGG